MTNDKEVVTCWCGEKEYYGLMHWLGGQQWCRKCMHTYWENTTEWKRNDKDYEFPLYVDGVNYYDLQRMR